MNAPNVEINDGSAFEKMLMILLRNALNEQEAQGGEAQSFKAATVAKSLQLLSETPPERYKALVVLGVVDRTLPGEQVVTGQDHMEVLSHVAASPAVIEALVDLLKYQTTRKKDCNCPACQQRRELENDPSIAEAVAMYGAATGITFPEVGDKGRSGH